MTRCALCLHDLPIFEGLSREEFSEVCLMAQKRILEKGAYLFHQGQPAGAVCQAASRVRKNQ